LSKGLACALRFAVAFSNLPLSILYYRFPICHTPFIFVASLSCCFLSSSLVSFLLLLLLLLLLSRVFSLLRFTYLQDTIFVSFFNLHSFIRCHSRLPYVVLLPAIVDVSVHFPFFCP
jgi:hypothetical protein